MELSRIVIVAVNVIFMIFGLAILVIGIVFKFGWDEVRNAFDDQATKVDFDLQTAGDAAGVAAITFGSIILVVALLGCAGACCNQRCLVGTYAVIVLMIVIAQIAVVALVATKGKNAEDNLKEGLQDSLKSYKENSGDDLSKSWSAIFDLGDCCAVTNFTTDFAKNPFKPDTKHRQEAGIKGDIIPITCCRGFDYDDDDLTKKIFEEKRQCLEHPTPKNAYTQGCYDKVRDWISGHKAIVIGVGVGVLLFELLLSALAFFLCCRERD